jgi:hypothetical protein
VSDLSPSFQQSVQQLQTQSAQIAESLQGTGTQRPWMVPEGDWSTFQPESINSLFDRKEANQAYQDALHDDGVMGEAASAKLQLDHLARQERAFRLQHLPLIRAAVHAAARRQSAGNAAGVHLGVSQQYAQNLLKVSKPSES